MILVPLKLSFRTFDPSDGYSYSGTGFNAYIAIGCIGANKSGPSVGYTYHYNMP